MTRPRFAVLRTVRRYLRPHRAAFAVALAQVLLISACELLKPWPLKLIVDHVLGDLPLTFGATTAVAPATLLLGSCVGLVVLYVALAGLQLAANATTIGIGQRMVADFRRDLYEHLQRLSPRFYAERSTGDLLARVTADTLSVQTLAMNGVFPLITAGTLFIGMAVIMASMDLGLTMVALSICPLIFVTISVVGARIRHVAGEARVEEGRLLTVTQRGIAGVRVVQAFTAEPEEAARFAETSRASLRAMWRLYLLQTLSSGVVGIIVAAGTALVLWVGATHVLAGTLSLGQVLVFVAYLASLYAPISNVSETVGMVQRARVGAERVLEILETDPDLPDGTGVLPRGRVRGEVAVRAVRFAYAPDHVVLRDVSFHVRPGEMVAVVGVSGAGKTTLAHLLTRFLDPSAGEVSIDGVDLRTLRLREVRRQIATVLQPPFVLPMTLRENVTYGAPFADDAAVRAALEIAQLGPLVARLPDGLETMLGEGGTTLSEGERQRVTIARAVLRDAPVLVLDEPTSALDAATEAALVTALRRHMQARATLMIAHRLSTVRHADRILVLHAGVIVEEGSFDVLLAAGGRFAALYAAQVSEPPCASS